MVNEIKSLVLLPVLLASMRSRRFDVLTSLGRSMILIPDIYFFGELTEFSKGSPFFYVVMVTIVVILEGSPNQKLQLGAYWLGNPFILCVLLRVIAELRPSVCFIKRLTFFIGRFGPREEDQETMLPW